MNTKIEYLYRDADNYKVHNACIIQGELSKAQQKVILDCLDMGEYFIPSRVGLPEERFEGWDEQSDHCWFELGEYSFSSTHQPATVDMTAAQLVKAFMKHKNLCWQPEAPRAPKVFSLDARIQSAASRSSLHSGTTHNPPMKTKHNIFNR